MKITKADIMRDIDVFLDIYNNYTALYKQFGDDYYSHYIDMALLRMKDLVRYAKEKGIF